MGGVIFVMPITFTMDLSAPRMLPSTSGYSSPKYSYSTTPRCPNSFSSSQACSHSTMPSCMNPGYLWQVLGIRFQEGQICADKIRPNP